ncbi:MAG: UDP-N-acetylmuramoyl-L-alanyl-D-glutamate--2,6-diaminopimelate ligase [Coxiellaceae bacterium]|nr:UDP-N-acetylmuramoyl-L-alanyl-D-glutamate--2,6-diaminopimelate ligase [Coxiellaceae bacterium]
MTQNIQSLKKLLEDIAEVDPLITVTGITNNSKQVKSGDLFIALNGDHIDARKFIPEAIEQGAAAVVYESSDGFSVDVSIPAIPVKNLNALQAVIATRFYNDPSKVMRCVGVTGTNGKTSCTQWIAQALMHYKIACGVIGTLGAGFPDRLNQTGYTTPDALLLQAELNQLHQQGAQAAAIEVSSHALSQHRLDGMRFDVAVFTQLSRDHLDYHETMENYKAAKKRLFEWPELNAAVLNIDDPVGVDWAAEFSEEYPVITYSLQNSSALIYAEKVTPNSAGFEVNVKTSWGDGVFQLPFVGRFNVSNALAVLSVLVHFDIPMKQALHCLSLLQPVPGRMELFGGDNQPAVVVDYAHTPDALKNALEALRAHCEGRLWCVFGCGGDRDQGKRPEMAKIAELYSDQVVVTNDNPRTESPQSIVNDIMAGFSQEKVLIETDRAKAIDIAIQKAAQKDTILVAGKGHEGYQIIGKEERPFSDSEQVKQALARRA